MDTPQKGASAGCRGPLLPSSCVTPPCHAPLVRAASAVGCWDTLDGGSTSWAAQFLPSLRRGRGLLLSPRPKWTWFPSWGCCMCYQMLSLCTYTPYDMPSTFLHSPPPPPLNLEDVVQLVLFNLLLISAIYCAACC